MCIVTFLFFLSFFFAVYSSISTKGNGWVCVPLSERRRAYSFVS